MPEIGGRYCYEGAMNDVANGRWCFAVDRSTGEEVFVKEFNRYRYPAVTIDRAEHEWAREADAKVDAFKVKMEEVNRKVGEVAGVDGDVVVALRFFRDDIFLYKVNRKVELLNWPNELRGMTTAQADALMSRLLGALHALHAADIIHNDLKPDNIFVTRNASGAYVGKLSDFDDSFFADDIPDAEDIISTPEYHSPEMRLYVANCATPEDIQPGWEITKASDIFSMGLIYHEYLTGSLPAYEENEELDSCASALLSGQTLRLSPSLDIAHRTIIEKMLNIVPGDRYTNCNAVRTDIQAIVHNMTKSHSVVVRRNGRPVPDERVDLVLPGAYTKVIASLKTDASGKANFGQMIRANYIVRCGETESKVDWTGSDTNDFILNLSSTQAPISATVSCGSERLKNVEVILIAKQSGHFITVATGRTNAMGQVTLGSVDPGTYGLMVKNPPEGYKRAQVSINVTNTNPFNASIALEPDVIKSIVKARVLDASTKQQLTGVSLSLYKADGTCITSAADTSGIVELGAWGPGSYTVKVEILPEGYSLSSSEPAVFTLEGANRGITLLAYCTIHVALCIRSNENLDLPGVTLLLCKRHTDGRWRKVKEVSTAENGVADFGILPMDEYRCVLRDLPEGYEGTVNVPLQLPVPSNGSLRGLLRVKRVRNVEKEHDFDPPFDGIFKKVCKFSDGSYEITFVTGRSRIVKAQDMNLYGLGAYL